MQFFSLNLDCLQLQLYYWLPGTARQRNFILPLFFGNLTFLYYKSFNLLIMKKYLLAIVLLFSFTVYATGKGSWTGWISDADCGTKGNSADHADCAKKCVKNGAAPVFVVGDKVYTISNPKKVAKFIGDKVQITGTLTGDAIQIEKVSK